MCYDRRELERGLIKFVMNVKSENSAIVCNDRRELKTKQLCYDRREIERGVIKFVTNVKSKSCIIALVSFQLSSKTFFRGGACFGRVVGGLRPPPPLTSLRRGLRPLLGPGKWGVVFGFWQGGGRFFPGRAGQRYNTQQVCYDRREIERGLIKFVTNVKSEDSASV